MSRKFSVVIGNPPYQSTHRSGNTLWNKFIHQNLNRLQPEGYLMYVTPPRWRSPEDKLNTLFQDYQLVFLSIHSTKEGIETFNASTPYDVYCIQNQKPYQPTTIYNEGEYDVSSWPLIPNHSFDYWKDVFNNNQPRLKVYQSYSHEDRNHHMSQVQTKHHPYPIIHKLTEQGIEYLYSSKRHQHQNTPKLVFTDQGRVKPVLDETSGCGKHIQYTLDTTNQMKEYLSSDEFQSIRSSVQYSMQYQSHKPLNYISI